MASIGIMGGTFDPIHTGHLMLAEQAREILSLDKVLFITAAVPPHKAECGISSAVDRHEMVKLAISDNPAFEPSELELNRKGMSYTVDTVETLVNLQPDCRFFLLLGSDEASSFGTWYRPCRIMELVSVAVANRPGCDVEASISGLKSELASQVVRLQMPGVDISSTDIRSRVACGKSIKYMVPSNVAEYIQYRGLYR